MTYDTPSASESRKLTNPFERYLTLRVALSIVDNIGHGKVALRVLSASAPSPSTGSPKE